MDKSQLSRRMFIGMAGAALVCPQFGYAEGLSSIEGEAFGTTWRLVGAPSDLLSEFQKAVEPLFQAVDNEMSPWRLDSDVSRLNSRAGEKVSAGAELLLVTRAALDLARASGGAFDPTVGPLVAKWGFGPIHDGGAPDWKGITTGSDWIAKSHESLTLDLCGIAKGRALDRAVELAKDIGIHSALLDLGGELRAVGHHPKGRAWQVAVEHPEVGMAAAAGLSLSPDMAVATSGLRNQSYSLGDRTWGHIIDPATERPQTGALRSVTVVAENAMLADGWATALFAAGDTAGPALARDNSIAALFLFAGPSMPSRVQTGAIADLLL